MSHTKTVRRNVLSATSVSICLLFAAHAALANDGSEPQTLLPPEQMDQRYVPGPTSSQTSPARTWQRGTYVSVQVNIDAGGNDILFDAANEPSITVDPTDPTKMAIGWRQFDTIASNFRQAGVAYSQDGGLTWTYPGVLDPGQFRSDPVLDFDAEGNFYYYSLSALDSIELFKSIDGGVTWGPPVDGFGGDKAWMAIDRTGGVGHGNIYAKWQTFFGCCGHNTFTRSIDGGQSFEFPLPVPLGPTFGTMDVGPDGEVYFTGIEGVTFQNLNKIVIARSTDAQNTAQVPTIDLATEVNLGGGIRLGAGPNPAGLLGQVDVATDHSSGPTRGNVYVLASVNPPGSDPMDVMFARSEDGGQTWSAPVRVNDDPVGTNAWQWFGTLSVAPNGRIDVIWNDTRTSGQTNISELYYSFSIDAGVTWSINEPVSPSFNSYLGWPQQNKLGDYYDTVSHSGAVHVTYAATFTGGQNVYYLRINHDCNDNGIPDDEDIANGTSEDCNINGTPDECEADCNATGQPDTCDIADGISEDCNDNNRPDECEADEDCNGNGVQDICDVAAGTADDCNGDNIPDSCQNDCNGNGILDECEVAAGTVDDCNGNDVPDECEPDCNENGVADECDVNDSCGDPTGSCPGEGDCCEPIGNGTPGCTCSTCCAAVCAADSFCCETEWDDICAAQAAIEPICACDTGGAQPPTSEDCDDNGVPDECDPDCNGNGSPDACDIADGISDDCNGNGSPDTCDLAAGTSDDCNDNSVPDECETDTDNDGVIDACDPCPLDFFDDTDNDGVCDSDDGCPTDPLKIVPGQCGCHQPDTDDDADGVPNCLDLCPGVDDDVFAPECDGAIPTTSQWGLVVLALLLMIGAKLGFRFGRRRAAG